MAFTFNWTPLTTATSSPEFYTHAKSLLTTALNASSPSAEDIVVEDLNLGQSAPEIEVLEIGDLADDKFRGVFRICYDGDACLTLRTRIQINPLNAHLSTTNTGFAAPEMVAAHTPLSIPLQVTLSEFKLSGFVILVFSRAKGITLVFRNDPLESMKVQSTFDSVPFIQQYLQQEIERQVRTLFQEELPMAVYRLSLRLFNPDHVLDLDAIRMKAGSRSPPISPSSGLWTDQSPADDHDHDHDHDQPFAEHALRLTALLDSHNTLALFTPGIRGALYRAKPPNLLHSLLLETPIPSAPSTPRAHGGEIPILSSATSRPGLFQSASTASLPGSRKKRHRVIDLRKKRPESETPSDTASAPELPPRRTDLREITGPAYSEPMESRNEKPPLLRRPQLRELPRHSSGILERAFMLKLVGELQKRADAEKEGEEGGMPPAY